MAVTITGGVTVVANVGVTGNVAFSTFSPVALHACAIPADGQSLPGGTLIQCNNCGQVWQLVANTWLRAGS